MSRYKDFREFYETTLRPDLEAIDNERKMVNRRVITVLVITALVFTLELIFIPSEAEVIKSMVPILTMFAGLVMTGVVSKNYRKDYKNKIISRITRFIDEGLIYTPEGSVPYSEFIKSDLFPIPCDIFSGEDHFRGRLGKTHIEFSEVTAKQKNRNDTGSGQKNDYIILFRGLFIVADFNKHFKTHTLVLPDTAERIFGKFGQTLQSISAVRGKLVRLENPDFEKEFCVYGEDQVEARYILSPSLMERILAFRRKWKSRMSLSFSDSKLYIAINMNRNLFETRIFRSVTDYDFMEENFRFLTLLTGLVDDLNLNTRIWTKD